MPDVWHPVSEEPPESGFYFVWKPTRGNVIIAEYGQYREGFGPFWHYAYGYPMKGVTHWAFITYPPAPEVE